MISETPHGNTMVLTAIKILVESGYKVTFKGRFVTVAKEGHSTHLTEIGNMDSLYLGDRLTDIVSIILRGVVDGN